MATKRERSSNWSLSEISILTEFFEKNEDVLKAKQSNLITNSRKNAKWAEVTEIINAVGIQRRTVDQVKFKWGNLQQSAKKSFSAARKQAKLTGRGPPPKPQPRLKRKSSIWWKIDLISAALLGASSPQCQSQQVWHNVGFWPINKLMQILEIKQLSILLENFTDDWDCMVCLHCRLTNTSQIDDVNYGYTLMIEITGDSPNADKLKTCD